MPTPEPAWEPGGPHHRMIQPIGFIRSCYGEKFGTPRQPGLCPSASATLRFCPGFRNPDMLRGIEGFSHLWIVFGFHQTIDQGWHPTVRPPRLGGNERVGVFASRSTFRPNSLGLSVVRLEKVISTEEDGPALSLGGVDLIDGTPVYDIKPYLPYADAIPDASSGFANAEITRLQVIVSDSSATTFQSLAPHVQSIIRETLSLDPRPPASPADPQRIHGMLLSGYNIRFRITADTCEIVDINPLPTNPHS